MFHLWKLGTTNGGSAKLRPFFLSVCLLIVSIQIVSIVCLLYNWCFLNGTTLEVLAFFFLSVPLKSIVLNSYYIFQPQYKLALITSSVC